MTELDRLIEAAFKSEGKQEDVNKVYLAFLKADLLIPTKKRDPELSHIDEHDPFSPLFAKIDDHYFLITFDTMERLENWAGEHFNEMDYVELSGKEIISGMNDEVFLCLNLGTPFYKEFSPEEIKRLKTIVSRIEQLKH